MSEEDAHEHVPHARRKADHRKGMAGAAVKVSEAQTTVLLARLSMIATPFLFGGLLWFAGDLVGEVKAQMKDQGDALQQVLINQAVGITERDDQKRRLTKIEDGMTRLWQHVVGRDKGNDN